MLPVETFTDVVSFLGYYDLGGLKLANKLFSAVAQQCAETIHIFDFADFTFYVHDSCIHVYRLDSAAVNPWRWRLKNRVCLIQLSNEKKLAEFISAAFRNCTIGRFWLVTRRELVLNAIRAVANTIIVADLHVIYVFNDFVRHLFELIDSFRRVKNTALNSNCMAEVDVDSLKKFCQRKHIPLELRE